MTTDPAQAERLAMLRAKRGQEPAGASAASTGSPHSATPLTGPPRGSPLAASLQADDASIWAPRAETPTQARVASAGQFAPPSPTTLIAASIRVPQRTTRRARTKRPHVAAGGRIATTGLAASAVLGLTGVIAYAHRPAPNALPAAPVTTPSSTTPVSADSIPAVAGSVVPAPTETVSLAIPPATQPGAVVAPAGATPAPAAAVAPSAGTAKAATAAKQSTSATPAPAAATAATPAAVATPAPVAAAAPVAAVAPTQTPAPAPVTTPAPAPPPTTAAPAPPPPPPPTTTKPSAP